MDVASCTTMSSDSPLISVRGLARSFKTRDGLVEAVRGIDFDVRAGELVGLLGPNGAGKTTTLRMLTTLLEPSAGQATVARPASGFCNVVRMRTVVVLPAPLGPSRPSTVPSSTARSSPSSAFTSP